MLQILFIWVDTEARGESHLSYNLQGIIIKHFLDVPTQKQSSDEMHAKLQTHIGSISDFGATSN